jgi:phosphoenolpyruvate-protein kinase (PTS system EI component)
MPKYLINVESAIRSITSHLENACKKKPDITIETAINNYSEKLAGSLEAAGNDYFKKRVDSLKDAIVRLGLDKIKGEKVADYLAGKKI